MSVWYISVGAIEAFALLTATLRLFRFRANYYRINIVVMSIVLALSSYLIRIVFEEPWFDIPLTMCAIIVFMNYIIKVKLQYAVIITLSGYVFYTAVQSVIFLVLNIAINFESSMLLESSGVYLYLLQTATAGVMILISRYLYKIGLGFSFIIHPPHSYYSKFSKKENTIFYAALVSFLVLTATIAFSLSGYAWLTCIIVLLNFSLLYYLLHRRSEQD
ncbi:hypothetical protein M5X06_16060 [Paenibacillus alvei]|uniref:Uncharacterized protein n=1 Tax=Paenibacillus alvei TaxID=44250 RepID=A0ABT4GQM5_PAEAL|nr:hypothetical protein [Paenibacillus alvei]EJW14687.1 hypothetical protein PAV_11c00280 [Paenibacillus alvei DSM 29]MCY9704954.1 hypothetical protein [Paenibacillus alvei]MCY9759001.1 hypothetical protein [Paenibacillus alvei]MCY9768334.1 hypothetical protein [Paenibacillus alvei]MEC0080161.1 hypothetical protein [Paenibacillus alvei]